VPEGHGRFAILNVAEFYFRN